MSDIEKARELLTNFRWDMDQVVRALDEVMDHSQRADEEALELAAMRQEIHEEAHRSLPHSGLWYVRVEEGRRERRYICAVQEAEALNPDMLRPLCSLEFQHDAACRALLRLWERNKGRGVSASETVTTVIRSLVGMEDSE